MVTTCDGCGAGFEPRTLTRREGEVEITYLVCPACSRESVVCRTNRELRKMQQVIENKRARLTKQTAQGKTGGKRVKEFQELVAQLKVKMDEFSGRGGALDAQ